MRVHMCMTTEIDGGLEGAWQGDVEELERLSSSSIPNADGMSKATSAELEAAWRAAFAGDADDASQQHLVSAGTQRPSANVNNRVASCCVWHWAGPCLAMRCHVHVQCVRGQKRVHTRKAKWRMLQRACRALVVAMHVHVYICLYV